MYPPAGSPRGEPRGNSLHTSKNDVVMPCLHAVCRMPLWMEAPRPFHAPQGRLEAKETTAPPGDSAKPKRAVNARWFAPASIFQRRFPPRCIGIVLYQARRKACSPRQDRGIRVKENCSQANALCQLSQRSILYYQVQVSKQSDSFPLRQGNLFSPPHPAI